jgi:hypothetical protein
MNKIKVFEKNVKLHGQRPESPGQDIKWKAMPEEMHMWNMKALPLANQKLLPTCPRRIFWKSRSNSKVMVSNERSCQKEYT